MVVALLTSLVTLGAANVPPDSGLIIVVNKGASSVSLIDRRSGETLGTLPTGANPHEVAASPSGRWAVVTDYGAQTPGATLTVIDLESRQVARTIDLSPRVRPHGAEFLPDDQTIAVTSERSGEVLLVDIGTGTVSRSLPTKQATSHMVALVGDRIAYTANISSGSISAIPISPAGETRTLSIAPQTEAIAVTPGGRQVWVGSNTAGSVTVVDTERWAVIDTVNLGGRAYRIGMTPDGKRTLFTMPDRNLVLAYDTETRRPLGEIATPGVPLGLAFSADSRLAYVTLAESGQVAEIDLGTLKVGRQFAAGAGPDGIAVTNR